MIRLTRTFALIPIILLALAGCDSGSTMSVGGTPSGQPEPLPEESPPPAGPDLAIGKANFEATCAGCHGNSGENIFRPLNPDNCLVANCTDLTELASFINIYMPPDDAQSCTLDGENSCALTTAAYIINGFTTEISDETREPTEPTEPTEPPDQNVQTPLARLTNDEYVNSIRTLLKLPAGSPEVEAAKESLVTESIIRGLSNDAETQALTQLTVSGYSKMAIAASSDFLSGVSSKEDLQSLLNCPALLENDNGSSLTRRCVEEFSKGLIATAYRRPANESDFSNITEIYDTIVAINDEAGNAKYDIDAHKATIQAIIQYITLSPEFILIVERGKTDPDSSDQLTKQLTDFEIATRMALFLAGTLPDETLLADASAGLLGNAETRIRHADRLMSSNIGTEQFTTLIRNWLGIDESITETADIEKVNSFITNWFVNEGMFSDLYQAPVTVEHTSGTNTTEPVGVLGLQAFVASHTFFPTPTFITRGVFVVEQLLCEALPDDIPDDALDAGELTPVEVFEFHSKQSCATCHKVFDNYGAAFQQFDPETSLFNPASQDFGSSFDLFNIGDINTSVSTLDDLGFSMGSSERASNCMAELWYRHSLRRNIDNQGKDNRELQLLMDSWAESGDKSMKSLLRAIVASDSFITLYL